MKGTSGKKMKFRATIDFEITNECMKTFYDNSLYKLKEELDAYFKHLLVVDFEKEVGIQGFYRGTHLKEL